MSKAKQSAISKIGAFIHYALDPAARVNAEQNYRQQYYGQQPPNVSLAKNQAYGLVSETGGLKAFAWSCGCGMFLPLPYVDLWLGREHRCPQCRQSFDILKCAGIKADTPHSAFVGLLAKLPQRPWVTEGPARRMVDTWGDDGGNNGGRGGSGAAGNIEYEPYAGKMGV